MPDLTMSSHCFRPSPMPSRASISAVRHSHPSPISPLPLSTPPPTTTSPPSTIPASPPPQHLHLVLAPPPLLTPKQPRLLPPRLLARARRPTVVLPLPNHIRPRCAHPRAEVPLAPHLAREAGAVAPAEVDFLRVARAGGEDDAEVDAGAVGGGAGGAVFLRWWGGRLGF